MRDMTAQCESNMSELQQLQVQPSMSPFLDCLSFPQSSLLAGTKDSTNREGVSAEQPALERFPSCCVMLARSHHVPGRSSCRRRVGVGWG